MKKMNNPRVVRMPSQGQKKAFVSPAGVKTEAGAPALLVR